MRKNYNFSALNFYDLFKSEQDLLDWANNKDGSLPYPTASRNSLTKDDTFMILEIAKTSFSRKNFDCLENSSRGGTMIQPVKVLAIGQDKIGWMPLTASRIKYLLAKT